MKVKALAKILGVTPDTVRYYARIGYVKPRREESSGYKLFSLADQQRFKFILGARSLGFTVVDIGNILHEADKGRTACPLVRKLIEQRLQETERQFQESVAVRKRMEKAVQEWSEKPDKQPTGHMICHLIEEFGT